LAIARIAGAALPRDLNEPERHKLANRWAYRMTLNAELDKMVKRAR
jgi:hypothetical protein